MSCDRNWLDRRAALALAGGLAVMAMIPENPVVGGTALRRQSIQSPNFVTGSTGWAIRQDGSAEFNNIVIRNGQVVSGTALYYSGPPALSNLIASIAAAAGTDVFGNAYLAGVASYFPSGSPIFAVTLQNGDLIFYQAASAAGPWTQQGTIGADASNNLNLSPAGTGSVQSLTNLIVNGSETISASAAAGPLLQVTNAVQDSAPLIRAQTVAAAAAQLFFGGLLAGDTNSRLVLDVDASGNPRIRFGPGNAAPDSLILRTAANKLAVNGADLDINTVGRGLQVAEGTNARMGLATLAAGTVTVNNTTITGSTRIFLSVQSAGGTQGFLRIASRTVGTAFTITSTSNTETSTVAWLLVEPG